MMTAALVSDKTPIFTGFLCTSKKKRNDLQCELNCAIFPPSQPMEASVSVTDFPDYTREKKTVTQDGMIWPLARPHMSAPRAIRERMAEDLAGLIRKRGDEAVILADVFLTLGWTREQIARHYLLASRLLSDGNGCGNDPSPDHARLRADETTSGRVSSGASGHQENQVA
jgi:hypothetical protein